jgi:hypothetical protein
MFFLFKINSVDLDLLVHKNLALLNWQAFACLFCQSIVPNTINKRERVAKKASTVVSL